MKLRGRAHRFGDDVNTDNIIASKYKAKSTDMRELARHLMEDIDSEFVDRIQAGDFIVAGRNFGSGSSREAAPRVIKEAGIAAVLAPSFARIFFRNGINVGLPLLPVDTSEINNGDELEVDLAAAVVVNLTQGARLQAYTLLPRVMLNIIADGGLAAHIRKHGTFVLD